jgi:hypothetical protein
MVSHAAFATMHHGMTYVRRLTIQQDVVHNTLVSQRHHAYKLVGLAGELHCNACVRVIALQPVAGWDRHIHAVQVRSCQLQQQARQECCHPVHCLGSLPLVHARSIEKPKPLDVHCIKIVLQETVSGGA